MSELSWQERQAPLIWVLALGLSGAGAYAATKMPSGIYPEVEFPRIAVVARSGDAPPDVTELLLTRPLEAELATVLGVERIHAHTIRGTSELVLQFSAGTDMWRALQLVDARIGGVRSSLPANAELTVERITTTSFPVLTFNLAGPIDPRELQEIGELIVRPALSRVPGVGNVEVLGGDRREVAVILDPSRAAALHLGPVEVAERLGRQLTLRSVGRAEQARAQEAVLLSGEALTLEDLARRPIAVTSEGTTVPLSAIAQVVEGAADRVSLVSGPKGETVLISVSRRPDASTSEVVFGVKAAMADLVSTFPPGVSVAPVYDQALLIDESIRSVRDAILLGILLCVVVIALFLKDLRGGLTAAVVLPITLGMSFLPTYWLGGSLNLMSLGGLAVAIGLVIDDAIVVVEGIRRRLEAGDSPKLAARTGVRTLYLALLGTTATTVVVFLPLARLSGVVGRFFSALATTLTASVTISLLLSVSLIPLIAARWMRPRSATTAPPYQRFYGELIRRVVQKPSRGVAAALLLLSLGAFSLLHLETGFLPDMDEGAVMLDYFLPASTSMQQTDRVAKEIEKVLNDFPEVQSYSRRTGSELGPATATLVSRGDIMVRLKPRGERSGTGADLIAQARAALALRVPEARTEFIQVLQDVLNDLAGVSRPIEIKIFGEDRLEREAEAAQVAALLEKIDGVEDVYPGFEKEAPELRLEVDAERVARLGLSAQSIAEQLDAAFHGVVVQQLRRPGRPIDLRLRFPDVDRFDEARMLAAPLWIGDHLSQVQALARLERAGAPLALDRENLRSVTTVTADHQGRDLGSVMKDVQASLAGFKLKEGYRLELGGQFREQKSTFADLAMVMLFGLLAVMVVLLAQFRRPILAVWVIACVPLSMVGAVVTLALSGTPLNASSLMGCVLLVGLVVKNGILLLEQVEHFLAEGQSMEDALVGAGALRLRPILMTTMATIAGLLPLVLGWGAGAEIQRPLAVAVVGGLSVSTVVSLVILPSLVSLQLQRAPPN